MEDVLFISRQRWRPLRVGQLKAKSLHRQRKETRAKVEKNPTRRKDNPTIVESWVAYYEEIEQFECYYHYPKSYPDFFEKEPTPCGKCDKCLKKKRMVEAYQWEYIYSAL